MSNSLKEAFQNLASSLGHCQENSRSIVDVLKRGCTDLANNSEGGGGGGSSQDYSTTEHVVGKWIDGTTDVYEKTYVYETPLAIPYDTWVDSGISPNDNIEYIIGVDITGSAKGYQCDVEVIPGASNYTVAVLLTTNKPDRDIKYMTLRYLKRTT